MLSYHRLRGSTSPVLTATGFVNGKGQFSTPYRSTPLNRSPKNLCLLGIFSHCSLFRGSKNPILGREKTFSSQTREIEKRAYYRNYCIDSNQILHSDKDHQMPFVGGPHTRITNPRWRTAAILEKSRNRYISAVV